jgi:CCR4-NOT transcription complex subunit 1
MNSADQREQEISACMLHNLFDEYRFFHKYPEKELRTTSILFGQIIKQKFLVQNHLIDNLAIKYVQ